MSAVMLCDTCGGSGIELGIECPDCDEDAMVCLVDHSPACSKCGGHGFDPELVEAVAERLYTLKWGPSMSGAHPGTQERDGALAVLSVVMERLER